MRPPFLQQRFLVMPLSAFAHLIASGIALAVGALQHNSHLRGRHLNLHRWLGRTYVIAVTMGGVAAFVLATESQAGLSTHVGFGLLAVLWVFATGMAYRYIRAGNQALHRRWMIRSYALTFAAVTLRVYLPLSMIAGLPFDAAYQTISWLAWVPNLIFAEWVILRQRAAALVPQLSATLASCLVLATGLSGCGGQTAERRTETPDTVAEAEPALRPESQPDESPLPQTNIEAPESGEEYVVRGVCPFECCKYGNWRMLRGGPLRSEPSRTADSVGVVAPGAAVHTDEGVMVLNPPGIAVVVPDTSTKNSSGPAVGDTVQVITYTGAKVSRVRWQGQELDMSWNALRMTREPLQRWWVHLTDAAGQDGWMLISGISAQEVGAPNSCSNNK
jgi:uncharacterized membrane protein